MEDFPARWRRQALIPTTRMSPETASSSPIYTALMAEWEADGRTLPNRYDDEWNEAVTRNYWPE